MAPGVTVLRWKQEKGQRMNVVAFDYGKQKWVEGVEAIRVREEQIHESLELLRGAKGAQFARFNGMEVETMIGNLEAELAGLKGVQS